MKFKNIFQITLFYYIHLFLLVECSVIIPRPFLNDQADKRTETPEDEDPIQKANEGILNKVFEGDIALTKQDLGHVDLRQLGDVAGQAEEGVLRKRSSIVDKKKLWPGGVVPIEITPELKAYPGMMEMINAAVDQFHKHTCIRMRLKVPADKNWVIMVRKKGCYSPVGRQYMYGQGSQEVSIGPDCESIGIIMHELMHAIGFYHEQSRYDRDKFVMVRWNNVQQGFNRNFNKGNFDEIDLLGIPYDLKSLMHYENYELTGNQLPTIQSIRFHDVKIGQRVGFTTYDALKINALYRCFGRLNAGKKRSGSDWGKWSEYSACDIDCRRYRQRLCATKDLNKCPEANAYGIQSQFQKCPPSECNVAINGNWGRWSEWTACSASCGTGFQRKERMCNSPEPTNGGKPCEGEVLKQQMCEQPTCIAMGRRRKSSISRPVQAKPIARKLDDKEEQNLSTLELSERILKGLIR